MIRKELISSIIEKFKVAGIYYEPQKSKNSCFSHATNMYFQQEYLSSAFIAEYAKLLVQNSKKVLHLFKIFAYSC